MYTCACVCMWLYACMFVYFFVVCLCMSVFWLCVCVPQGIPEQEVRASTRQMTAKGSALNKCNPWHGDYTFIFIVLNHSISHHVPVMLLQRHHCQKRHRFRRV